MSLEFMKAKIARNDLRTVKKLKSTNRCLQLLTKHPCAIGYNFDALSIL